MTFLLQILQQVLFLISLVVMSFLLWKRIKFIKRNIQLGKKLKINDNKWLRLKKMILLAFGQKKMFDRPIAGLMHFIIYISFLLINIELLEIVLDGLTSGHRLFSKILGKSYIFLINFFEFFALAVVIACAIFLIRRNILKISRFKKPEMRGWATKDANIILIWEILLMTALYTMNATDTILQTRAVNHYPNVGNFAVSSFFIPIYENFNTTDIVITERLAWWIHILGIMAFTIYITYSKHLHIFLAFPNVYYSKFTHLGKMHDMPEITKEVQIMLGKQIENETSQEEVSCFGAKDVTDLTWKNLMDAYTCTECGRCSSECPANQTGKKLSPRKIMMDTRNRVEELGKHIDQYGKEVADKKNLYNDYITKEELMACTTCNACVETCPVGIDPLSIILQMRRYIAMEESDTPAAWNGMFSNIENNFAPWAFPATDRFKWSENFRK